MTERTFTFRLSASGVEELVRQLRATGDAGEAMAQRLLNSSAQIGNSLQRTEAAIDRTRAALERTQAVAARGIGGSRFQAGLQAAGFQIGDFITQVQGGQSVFTAFAQQGGQLAGALAGGFAGLLVQVGAVAAQMLFARSSTEGLTTATMSHEEALRFANDRLKTSAQLAREAADARDDLARSTLLSTRAIESETLALLRADAEFAAASSAAAQNEASRPRRRGTLQGAAATLSVQGAQLAAGEIAAAIGNAERALATTEAALANLARPRPGAGGEPARGAAAGGEAERVLAGLRREQEQITSQAEALARASRSVDEVYEDQIANINRLLPRLVELNGVERANEIAARASVEAYNERARSLERGAERASGAARELGFAFSSAFEDAIIKGQRLSSVVSGLATDIARVILRRSVTDPLANAASSLIGGINFGRIFNFGTSAPSTAAAFYGPSATLGPGFADGGVFRGGNVIPFASGGIVGGPTLFPMAGGRTGLMGEAGPEAIMPLARDSRGRLGVSGGGPNITTQIMVDARGADPGSEARLRVVAQEIVKQSTAATLDAIRRGGAARAIVRGA